MSLTREQILAKQDDLPTRDVPIPEWGGETVRVRGLNARDRFDWAIMNQKALEGKPSAEPTSYLVALSCVDDDGKRIFKGQDADAIANLPGAVVERVATAAMELSGLAESAEADAEGNSGATSSGDSATNSPSDSDAPSPS